MADTFKTSEVPAFSGKAVDWPLFKAELCIFLMRFSVDIDSADQTGPGISNQVANKRQRVYAVTMMTALPKRWLLSYYEMKDDGYRVYQALKSRFEHRDVGGKLQARKELFDARLRNKLQAEAYIHEVQALKARFLACGGTITDDEMVEVLVTGLTADYTTVKDQLDAATAAAPLSWDAAVDLVLRRVSRLQRECANERRGPSDGSSTSSATHPREKKSRHDSRSTAGKCRYCGKPGHTEDVCRKKERDKARDSYGRPSSGAAPRPPRTGSGQNPTCYRCGQRGHIATRCTAPVEKHKAYMAYRRSLESPDDPTAVDSKPRNTAYRGTLFMMRSRTVSGDVPSGMPSDDDAWFIDTFASDCATGDRRYFIEYEDYHGRLTGVGDASVVGRGLVSVVTSSTEGHPIEIQFRALHVPTLTVNIISEPKLRSGGHYVKSNQRGATIELSTGQSLATTRINGYVALLPAAAEAASTQPCTTDGTEAQDRTVKPQAFAASAAPTGAKPLELWHQRCAHADYRTVLRAASVTDGLTLSNRKIPESLCEPCVTAKMKKVPFPSEGRRALTKGELILNDLQGPLPFLSRQGNYHKSIFVDDKTGFAFLYFLKRKSDVKQSMEWFLQDSGLKAIDVTLRSDNAPEIVEAAEALGFKHHEKTCPHTPEQNGRAEKYIDTNNADSIALLHASGLPYECWEDASRHAIKIRNRLPHHGGDTTPYQNWYRTRPNMEHLRVFGCTAYPLIAKEARAHKLSPHSTPHAYIGFTPDHSGYLLLDPESFKEKAARHVRFDESRPAGDLFAYREADDLDDDYIPEPDDATPTEETTERTNERPRRVRRAPREFWHIAHHAVNEDGVAQQDHGSMPEPKTYREAICGPEAHHWENAIQRELDQMIDRGVWTIINRSEATSKPIPTKWTFKRKLNVDGTIDRYKARLCVCGNHQDDSTYDLTYAPVAPMHLTRIFTAKAVHLGALQYHIDVKGAYLSAPIKEDVYLRPPQGLEVPRNVVCKLNFSMYGAHQSNRNWVLFHKDGLEAGGYSSPLSEPCVFVKIDGDKFLLSEVHTDDADIVSNCEAMVEEYRQTLEGFAEVGSIERLDHFCGMSITRNADSAVLSQVHFIRKKLQELGLTETRTRHTPAECAILQPANDDELIAQSKCTHFRSLVGSAQWPANNTRPDCAWAANHAARFTNRPGKQHQRAALHILQYLRTHERGVKYEKSASLGFSAYADADWGSDPHDRKPFLGWVLMMCGGPIMWRSKKAGGVALSTCEAEYMAAAECAQDVLYVRRLLREIAIPGVDISAPTVIHIDNRSAKSVAEMLANPPKLRHVSIRFHFIRDLIEKEEVIIEWIAGSENPADILTKPLARTKFEKHSSVLTVPAEHSH